MPMLSTRGAAAVSESTAILRGLAPDGGLYVPQTFPHFSLDEIAALSALDYQARALTILQKFLPDFTADELKNAIAGAYGTGFDDAQIAPVRPVGTWAHALELWHGPTLAFKDMALQLLPHLLQLGVDILQCPHSSPSCSIFVSGVSCPSLYHGFLLGDSGRCRGKGVRPAGRTPFPYPVTGTRKERPLIRHGIRRDTFPPEGGRLFGRLEAAPARRYLQLLRAR